MVPAEQAEHFVRSPRCYHETPGFSHGEKSLVTVADAQGLRFDSEPSLCQRLSLTPEGLRQARERLVHLGLVASERPLYQVWALGEDARGRERATPAGDDEAVDIKAVFAQIWEVLS